MIHDTTSPSQNGSKSHFSHTDPILQINFYVRLSPSFFRARLHGPVMPYPLVSAKPHISRPSWICPVRCPAKSAGLGWWPSRQGTLGSFAIGPSPGKCERSASGQVSNGGGPDCYQCYILLRKVGKYTCRMQVFAEEMPRSTLSPEDCVKSPPPAP